MAKRRKVLLIAGGIVVLALIAVLNITLKGRGLVTVQTAKVLRQDLTHIVSASGNIKPKHSVEVSADIAGKITRIAVEEGDRVRKGQLLLIIDPAPYRAELLQQEAALASARAEFIRARASHERARNIYESQRSSEGQTLISDEEMEKARTAFEVAQAQVGQADALVDRAREYLGKTTITSPMDGVVTARNVDEGEIAVTGTMNNPGTVLLTVADLWEMEAEVDVDETDIVDVQIGQKATVKIDAYPDTSFEGRVAEIGNSPILKAGGIGAGREAVDFKVTVAVLTPPPGLKPGLSATADIVSATREKALALPIQALTVREIPAEGTAPKKTPEKKEQKGIAEAAPSGQGTAAAPDTTKEEKEGAFVIQDGKARFVPVTTGIMGGMNIEVLSGLEEGKEVIAGPYTVLRDLKDGTRVKVDNTVLKKASEKERKEG